LERVEAQLLLSEGASAQVIDEGRRAEAHALLAPIYGWFTEGFAMLDLQEAKALLSALS
jgi:hypothetical protein